jgi:hypothetical protein
MPGFRHHIQASCLGSAFFAYLVIAVLFGLDRFINAIETNPFVDGHMGRAIGPEYPAQSMPMFEYMQTGHFQYLLRRAAIG